MLKSVQFIVLLLFLSHADLIYPIKEGLQYQWHFDIWKNCVTNKVVEPKNCFNDENNWTECYEISNEGICAEIQVDQQFVDTQANISLNFMNIQSNSQVVVQIGDVQQNINLNQTRFNYLITTFLKSVSFQVKLTSDKATLNRFEIHNNCLFANCEKCFEDLNICMCQQNYNMYNFHCTPNECLDQVQLIGQHQLTKKLTIDEDRNLIIDLNYSKLIIGDCLIPFFFLTQSLEDSTIKYVFPKEMISLQVHDNMSSFRLKIPFNQLGKTVPCTTYETSKDFVYQCNLNMALTQNGKTQYQLILLTQLLVNKELSSSLKVQDQMINVPTECCEDIKVFSIGESSLIKVDTKLKQLEAKLILSDPTFSESFTVKLISAQAKYDNKLVPLKQISYQLESQNILFLFSYSDDLVIDQAKIEGILIEAEVKKINKQRILEVTRSNFQITYLINTENYLDESSTTSEQTQTNNLLTNQTTSEKSKISSQANPNKSNWSNLFFGILFGTAIAWVLGVIVQYIRGKYFPQQNFVHSSSIDNSKVN